MTASADSGGFEVHRESLDQPLWGVATAAVNTGIESDLVRDFVDNGVCGACGEGTGDEARGVLAVGDGVKEGPILGGGWD